MVLWNSPGRAGTYLRSGNDRDETTETSSGETAHSSKCLRGIKNARLLFNITFLFLAMLLLCTALQSSVTEILDMLSIPTHYYMLFSEFSNCT